MIALVYKTIDLIGFKIYLFKKTEKIKIKTAIENTVLNRLFKVLSVSILNGIVLALIVYFGLSIFDELNFLNLEIYSKTAQIVSISLFSIVRKSGNGFHPVFSII